MKRILLFFVLLCSTTVAISQSPLNITLASQVTTFGSANDCWGWWDGQGNEYAIVGVVSGGVSIVDITNPANPQIVGNTQGPPSIWRDIKSFEDYVYVIHDFTPGQPAGLQIIDMSALPNIVYKDTVIANMAEVHNLYIDDGYAYLCGSPSAPGFNVLDLNPDPWRPNLVGSYTQRYVHDIYVRDDIAYASEVEYGLTVIDVSDKTNLQVIGQRPYVNSFTHNAWLNDSSTICFTTDEVSGGFVQSWDVSDLQNITKLDQYRSSVGAPQYETVPHNVHVLNDYLVTSYYRDGLNVADATYPYNIIETGYYDTHPLWGDGFDGNWGAYPFFPSGTCIASDAPGGLFVFNVNYKRACYLEGNITDASSGLAISGATITVQGQNWGTNANGTGFYASGTHAPGTYTVTYSHFGYQDSTITVTLSNGNLTVRDIPLQPVQAAPANILVTESVSGLPIPNAKVELKEVSGAVTVTAVGDANGNVNATLFPGTYTLITGAWSWKANETTLVVGSSNNNFSVQLDPGYQDEFALDLGWTVTTTASAGSWERGDPEGVEIIINPFAAPIKVQAEDDIQNDIGTQCYITGLAGGGNPDDNDLDDGIATLTSPLMDLSSYQDPVIRFHRWFYNDGGQTTPNDTLTIEIDNGLTTVVYQKLAIMWNNWFMDSIVVSNYITPTANMRVHFRVGDYSPGHDVEAGIDGFSVVDQGGVGISETANLAEAEIAIFPNPIQDHSYVRYDLGSIGIQSAQFELADLQGKVLYRIPLHEQSGEFRLQMDLPKGMYFGILRSKEGILTVKRILK